MKQINLFTSMLILSMATLGCGKGESRLPTVDVTAKVFVDDKPYGPAMVSMSSPDKDKKLPNSTGRVKEDGTASLVSYPNSKGIVPGNYSCNLLSDPLAMKQPPMVAPLLVDIKKDSGQTVELRFKTMKNAPPGMIPPPSSGGAPATTSLAPIR